MCTRYEMIRAILDFMEQREDIFGMFYVGVTNDIHRCLAEHDVFSCGKRYVFDSMATDWLALEVENFFLTMGMQGKHSVVDGSLRYVYCYEIGSCGNWDCKGEIYGGQKNMSSGYDSGLLWWE